MQDLLILSSFTQDNMVPMPALQQSKNVNSVEFFDLQN